MIRGILIGLLTAIIIAVLAFYVERYINTDVDGVYFIFDLNMPESILSNKGFLSEKEKLQVLMLRVENHLNEAIIIKNIKLFGIKKYYDSVFVKKYEKHKSRQLVLKHNGEYSFFKDEINLKAKDELIIHIWGDYYRSTYVTANMQGKDYSFDRLIKVGGVEKYLSIYWEFILTLIIILFVFVIFIFKSNVKKDYK